MTPTRNPHITLLHTGNLYRFEPGDDLHKSICASLIHFAKKHKTAPIRVLVHPDVLQGYEGELVIESRDNGSVYRAEIVGDVTQRLKSYMITGGE